MLFFPMTITQFIAWWMLAQLYTDASTDELYRHAKARNELWKVLRGSG